jgi:hypothetical protein
MGAITPTGASQTSTCSAVNANGKAPYWTFNGTAGTVYHFNLCSSTSTANGGDFVLTIYDAASPGGNVVAANDDGSCPYKSSITFICPATQVFYVCADVSIGALPFTFDNSGTVALTYYICGATSAASLPFSENWTTSNVTTACSSWIAHGMGAEGDWLINDGTIGPAFACCQAGGAGNEVEFTGNQADIYGTDKTETATLTSPKLNTTSVTSMTFSWKQSLGVTNYEAATNNTVIIKLQSSSDLINWTDQYSYSYTTPSSGLKTPIWQATQSVTFAPSGNSTWLRFYINAEPFKVWGWFMDNGGGTGTILPVEMLSFTGKSSSNNVTLEWETASEKDNDHFTVERSADAQTWNEIGSVKGSGNASTASEYNFTDVSPFENVPAASEEIYYRLKQTDYDGKFEYIGPIGVKLSAEDEWKLSCNTIVSENELRGTILSKQGSDAIIEVLDLQGRILEKENLSIAQGRTSFNLDITGFAKGAYVLKIYDNKNFIRNKFIKT